MPFTSVKNIDYFQLHDAVNQTVLYGCSQEWYRTRWQRLSGCGPTTAANLVYYHLNSAAQSKGESFHSTKAYGLTLMEKLWNYITPTLRGVSNTKLFSDGTEAFAKVESLELSTTVLNIPKDRTQRPGFPAVLSFLKDSLERDFPVAFLNLDSGEEKKLDSWHWVTVAALEVSESGTSAIAKIIDEEQIKQIDLSKWYQTTKIGGGFVRVDWL